MIIEIINKPRLELEATNQYITMKFNEENSISRTTKSVKYKQKTAERVKLLTQI